MRNADENPSPDRYNVIRDIRNRKKGKSFGLAFSYYQKVYLPDTDIVNIELAKSKPAVGTYKVAKEPG